MIPILSGATQWLSIKITSSADCYGAAQMTRTIPEIPMGGLHEDDEHDHAVCFLCSCVAGHVQIGLGLYWIASAVFRTVISVYSSTNILDKEGVDVLIEKNQ